MSIVSCVQIKMARSALGWSTQKLSEESGVSARTLNRIETNEGISVCDDSKFETRGNDFAGRWHRIHWGRGARGRGCASGRNRINPDG